MLKCPHTAGDGRHTHQRRLDELDFALGLTKGIVHLQRGQVDVGLSDDPRQLAPVHIGRAANAELERLESRT